MHRASRVAPVLLLCSAALPAHAAPAPAPVSASDEAVAAESRELLDALLRVETVDAHETDALRPIAGKLRAAGLSPEIVESAPGRGNLVVKLTARVPRRKPLLLLAHVDVVPVKGQKWSTPPFVPTVKDGVLYARGVGDDKSMAAAFTAVVLALARSHAEARLSRDVVLALTAGEETGGAAGVRWLMEHRPELLSAGVALNENGAILVAEPIGGPLASARKEGAADDGSAVRYVAVQAAEKIFQSYRLEVKGAGGHSSVPPPSPDDDPVLRLARALVKVGELRFPLRVLPQVREGLGARAPFEKGALAAALRRAAAAGEKSALSDEDARALTADPPTNAQLRTTCVTTQLEAAPLDNVLPVSASAVVNCRILPDETPAQTEAALARAIGDARVTITPLEEKGSAPGSPVTGEVADAVRRVVARLWPGVPVAHTMSAGASDSRFLREHGIPSYGLTGAAATLAESRTAHGPDERRRETGLRTGVLFLRAVVDELTK